MQGLAGQVLQGIRNVAARDGTVTTKNGSPLVTPDGRYLVVRGRLWRRSDPHLRPDERAGLVDALMHARRAVAAAKRRADPDAEAAARAAVECAKRGLGERGPVWWTDGAPDLNRHMARNTPYAAWFTTLASEERSEDPPANESGTSVVPHRGPVTGRGE